MCGIIGVFNQENQNEKILKGLEIIKDRGRDFYGISNGNITLTSKNLKDLSSFKESNLLGHCLHSIVGLVPQPLQGNNSTLTTNCEIYNWEELNEKYSLDSKNDAELLLNLLDMKGIEALNELDGVFALAYLKENKLYLARDILGIKPLWFSKEDGLFFCSESKVLREFKQPYIQELNPRLILIYNIKEDSYETIQRDFFSITPLHKESLEEIKKQVIGYLTNAIAKRIPNQKFGILFSGGIDSTIIAVLCQQLGVDFTCYTSAFKKEEIKEAEDLQWAKEIADHYGFELKINELDLKTVHKYFQKVVPLIENNNGVKASVGLTIYAACELAKKDGVKVIFSGLGSEEIFAGYQRHRDSHDINKECLSGLRGIYERDSYRDDVITMNNNLELRIPFLDKALCDYSLKIPSEYKIKDGRDKIILREISKDLGIPEKFAERPKKAAQYGSKFDKALRILTNKYGHSLRIGYLRSLYPQANERIGILFSSGKDSCLALHTMKKMNYTVECLITIKSKNKDSWMFHTPNIDMAELQAKAMEIPILIQETAGEKEKELKDLEAALQNAKNKYHIEGVATGALFSSYQRDRIEKVCDKLGLKVFSPLWHMDQEEEMNTLVDSGFEFILSSIAADGLDKSWLGKVITKDDVKKLSKLNKKNGINIAFEGGEAESFVIFCPEFKRRLKIEDSEIIMENKCTGRFIIKKIKLE